ncbi:MAG: hypothetical protein JST41_00430 [Bacteroidetes bacterium]|nr:hypothetical protein [Bacteroidota bacterium]MBX7129520.1 hypothetical protein [Flavobacteriales bacterium]MCC6653838.1 hypothetical protein [Flavobacteriales bacterium]HMU13709.1 hypothetical protein [Flavobacteriales bacterium]HNI04584.1 hypothetical protein [Flavobacteriales bacterium]
MENAIITTLIGTFAIGSLGLLATLPEPPGSILAKPVDEASDVMDTLQRLVTYDLRVADGSRYDLNDSLFWSIEDRSGERRFISDVRVLRQVFPDTGRYVVNSFRHMRVIARDTFVVVDGERFDIEWPDAYPVVGDEMEFGDYSTGALKDGTLWHITGDSTDTTWNEPNFTWRPVKAGAYSANVRVQFGSGLEKDTTWHFLVSAPAPVKPDPDLPRKEVVVRKKRRSAPPPRRAPPPPAPNAAFGREDVRFTGRLRMEIESQDRKKITDYRDSEVAFLFTPPVNCVLDRFSYYTQPTGGKGQITIKCISPERTPPVEFNRPFVCGFDREKATSHPIANMPVMFEGVKYRISIKPVIGTMGYFPIQGNRFGVVDEQGGRLVGKGAIQFTSDTSTCLFDVVFRAAQ